MAKRVTRERPNVQTTHVRVTHLEQRWQLPQSSIYRYIDQGLLGHTRIGRTILVPLAEVERFELERFIAPTDRNPAREHSAA